VFADPARARLGLVRVVVAPGSPVIGRLLAAAIAHAAVLSIGLLLVRKGWRRHRSGLVLAGLAMQAQVALGVIGAQPSVRELEATGVSFAANALLPWLVMRTVAMGDALNRVWPPLLAASLVAVALLVAYAPAALYLLLRDRTRRLTFGTVILIVVSSAACAGIMREENAAVTAPAAVDLPAAPPVAIASRAILRASNARPSLTFDRWFDDQPATRPMAPSRVAVIGGGYHYQYIVNGQPEVIKGMGLNTQYASQLSAPERAARLEEDMASLQALGVNTVLGWDPAEFDDVLLDAAQRHGIGVVMPFELDPAADYTDPAFRQALTGQVLAWVARYRDHPALRMWGLGNEVLHKIVHPAWVGPQDQQRERQAEAFSDWLLATADAIHALDPDHPVTYRSAEDAFIDWVIAALNRRGGGPRPWFVWGTNCYQPYLEDIVDHWPDYGMPLALWVSEFAPGGMAVPDRPAGFEAMWGITRRHPDWVLGGAVYAWTRNGPEGVDRNFGLTDDGAPVDGKSLEILASLFHTP
jgi:hypothetical protein